VRLDVGDPTDEVNLTWRCYQQLRSIYHATPAKRREIAIKVLDSFHTCRSQRSPGSAAHCAHGGPRCWPTSTPQVSPTAEPKPST
jgi:hypothetical protein